jgi:hypothetical protein
LQILDVFLVVFSPLLEMASVLVRLDMTWKLEQGRC